MQKLTLTPPELLIYLTIDEAIERIARRLFELQQGNEQKVPAILTPETEEPITIDQACAFYKISRVTLNNWRKQGLVTVHGMGRRKYLYKSEMMESLKQPKRYGQRSTHAQSARSTAHNQAA